eukprot:GILI01008399.1.p1 GENE.GILI01008399.1~~GILI01008399.1.p1  ORF type:complete len:380 (+),score=103.94 GILI01008399.1:41-1141(+)
MDASTFFNVGSFVPNYHHMSHYQAYSIGSPPGAFGSPTCSEPSSPLPWLSPSIESSSHFSSSPADQYSFNPGQEFEIGVSGRDIVVRGIRKQYNRLGTHVLVDALNAAFQNAEVLKALHKTGKLAKWQDKDKSKAPGKDLKHYPNVVLFFVAHRLGLWSEVVRVHLEKTGLMPMSQEHKELTEKETIKSKVRYQNTKVKKRAAEECLPLFEDLPLHHSKRVKTEPYQHQLPVECLPPQFFWLPPAHQPVVVESVPSITTVTTVPLVSATPADIPSVSVASTPCVGTPQEAHVDETEPLLESVDVSPDDLVTLEFWSQLPDEGNFWAELSPTKSSDWSLVIDFPHNADSEECALSDFDPESIFSAAA